MKEVSKFKLVAAIFIAICTVLFILTCFIYVFFILTFKQDLILFGLLIGSLLIYWSLYILRKYWDQPKKK